MNGRPGGLPWRRLLTAALAAAAILVYWLSVSDRGGREVVRETAPAPTAGAVAREAPPGWGTSVGFADQRRLDEHYEKHGAEFGRITKHDYLRQAQLLRDARVGGPILETVRKDGVVTRFDRDTGAFIAFNPNGVIRTFFKPNDGERYYRRQSERGRE
jgi:pyocin large subunit-like protein